MQNKKIKVCIVFFILNIILIDNFVLFLQHFNSKIYFPNFNKYNESSTSNSNILSQSQSGVENQTSIGNIAIFNSLGVMIPISEAEYLSYNGGNITVEFNIIDLDNSNKTILDENNQATYLIKYNKTTGNKENGILLSQISFNNRIKNYTGVFDTSILSEGTYTITIDIDLVNYTFVPYNFTLTLKPLLALQMISISHVHGVITIDSKDTYNTYPKANITVKFRLLEMNFNISEVLDKFNQANYLIKYYNVSNTRINGTLSNYIKFDNKTETYSGVIETPILPQYTYYIEINITLLNYTFVTYRFKLRVRRYLALEMISISDPGGVLEKQYTTFIGSNITVNFNIISMDIIISEFSDLNNIATYQIIYSYENLSNYISFNKKDKYKGIIDTSVLSEGTFEIRIYMNMVNNTFQPYVFTLIIIKKYELLVSVVSKPSEIRAGEIFVVTILAQYKDELEGVAGVPIKITVFDNNVAIITTRFEKTDEYGYLMFTFTLPLKIKTNKLSFYIETSSTYNFESIQLNLIDIRIITLLDIIITLIIYIGVIISSIIISILIYIRLIIPKKREKIRIINEYKQTLEDIFELNYIFIILKRNGKSIFHKSYIPKKINQERINKYIASLSIFKNSIKSQILLSEITYEGKILLLADGTHVRASLVINKEGSSILKNNLKEFIYHFENNYENILENWQDDLIPYKEIEHLLEDKLNISITLPHKIEYNFLDNISLLKSDSKLLLNRAKDLIKETGENFFYISTLLKEFFKRPFKGIAKFFVSFQELRKNKIFATINENSI